MADDGTAASDTALLAPGLKRQAPDWKKFGLNAEGVTSKDGKDNELGAGSEPTFEYHAAAGEKNEIYAEHQLLISKQWWKANFFVSEPTLFGMWDGVFTSCMINIFGVLIFLRMGWMVGNAGIGLSILIIFITISVAFIAVTSAIGVCERCRMESGGVYFLLSHVMGARFGASVGILYCLGQAIACALYVVGFGESITSMFHQSNEWIARGIAVGVLILLFAINVAGVKWVIRLQLVLLFAIFVAILDFSVGSFVHKVPEHGFIGYDTDNLLNNTNAEYSTGESFFTVFGVFFPTATGVFAGINMSGDLRNPSRDIPIGTLAAIGTSTVLYLLFVVILGATCLRFNLQTDYMIAEKVSATGMLFLIGLYTSTVSSGMGGLYGSPRILQCIASDGTIPVISFLSKGKGPNKVPVFALAVIAFVALVFIIVGQVNTLGPIVAMPFMVTYAAVDYAHFVLVTSFDKRKTSEYDGLADGSDKAKLIQSDTFASETGYGAIEPPEANIGKQTSDAQKVFKDGATDVEQSADMIGEAAKHKQINTEILRQPRSCYSIFCNRWLSLFGALISLAAMFGIQWGYAIATIVLVLIIYIYTGIANPGAPQGIAEFSMWQVIKSGLTRCCRIEFSQKERLIVTPGAPALSTAASQLNEENEDYAYRERYHQTEVIRKENMEDYGSG